MKNKIFKYRLVYYLAIMTSLVFFLISSYRIFGLFENFNLISFAIVITSVIINLFAFINLIEKYAKAILFLNLSLFLFIGVTLIYLHFKFLILLILILIIVNVFKVDRHTKVEEIDNIGKHED